jgi:hypothetical protein
MRIPPESPGCLDEWPEQNRNVRVGKIDGFLGIAHQAIRLDATVQEPPLTSLLDEPIPIGSLTEDSVATRSCQRDHGRALAGRFVAVNHVEVVQGHVPALNAPGMDLGVFPKRGTSPNRGTVDLERSIGCETLSPTFGVVRINGVAVKRAQLMDGELLEPVVHALLSSAQAASEPGLEIGTR